MNIDIRILNNKSHGEHHLSGKAEILSRSSRASGTRAPYYPRTLNEATTSFHGPTALEKEGFLLTGKKAVNLLAEVFETINVSLRNRKVVMTHLHSKLLTTGQPHSTKDLIP